VKKINQWWVIKVTFIRSKNKKKTKLLFGVKTVVVKVNLKKRNFHIYFFLSLGRCYTNLSMDAILSGPTEHSHAPSIDQIPVVDLQNKIKTKALNSEEPTSNILFSTLRSFPLDAAGQLPRNDTLLRTIRRQRQAEPTNPDNQLPDRLKQTDRGDNFILHEENDLIIFTTNSNLSILKTCKHWFADGTFKVKTKNSFFLYE
jgi:hypothetical protein